MFCSKCGTENAEGNEFCSSCGTKLSGGGATDQGTPKGEAFTQMAKSLPPGALTIAAACFIFLGTLLPWATASGFGYSASQSGIQMAQGAALLLVAVLCIAVLLLQRSGAAGAWSQVSILFVFLAVVLVFQGLYHINDSGASTGAGYWLSMIGVLILVVNTALQFFGGTSE
ncbi:MAG: zinc ribbon domain-containing protein [Dehalococcoidia bacterium]|nr:MAG: zinc ribbon domain-containing protein [Dehalococcoidia bacterium]